MAFVEDAPVSESNKEISARQHWPQLFPNLFSNSVHFIYFVFIYILQHRDWRPRVAYARKSASTEDDIVELAMDKLAVNLGVVNSSGPY